MTGYGASQASIGPYNIDLKIKSLNSRYLDVKFHCPVDFAELEIELKKKIKKKIIRGKVDIYLHKKMSAVNSSAVSVNKKAMQHWAHLFNQVKANSKSKDVVSAEWLLKQEGVVQVKTGLISASQKKAVLALFDKSLSDLVATRKKEGHSLKVYVSKELRALKKGLNTVKQKQKKRSSLKATQKKIIEKWKSIDKNAQIDENRITQEVIAYIDRLDLSEEMSRLDEHIKQMNKLFSGAGPCGKKLDFYCQELFREVNTIGSKANDSELTLWVVEAKNIIEKLREQAQNIQ